MHQGADSV